MAWVSGKRRVLGSYILEYMEVNAELLRFADNEGH